MAYSSNKPYQRTVYRGITDATYDRHLKESTGKESVLEKPYKTSTYGEMQQNYNPPLPPPIDPGAGTGGFECIWTETDCTSLISCWAGSDILLEGPEAATAGYLPLNVVVGEVIESTIGGSENRGITIEVDYTEDSHIIQVSFKDALGVVHSQIMQLTCASVPYLDYVSLAEDGCFLYEPAPTSDFTTINNSMYLGYDADISGSYWCPSLTFELTAIAPGTTISSAEIILYKKGTATIHTQTATVYTQDLDDGIADVFSILPPGDIDNDIAYPVTWNITEYGTSVADHTPITTADVSVGVQAILNRPGYVEGNMISFFIVPTASDGTGIVDEFDEAAVGNPTYAARLRLTF